MDTSPFVRKTTRAVRVGSVGIGAGAPVSIQSMTNTATENVDATLAQIEGLAAAGCDIVRLAVPNRRALRAFAAIRRQTRVPLVADIHFSHELAIGSIEAGADKVRINPGNIGSPDAVRAVVDAAQCARIPIRIGVNAGSLEADILKRFVHPVPEALVASALRNLELMHRLNFNDVVISIKASNVPTTIAACRLLAARSDVPQHIGITESGTVRTGSIRSAVGLGVLLCDGIGDTIRVSLAGDPLHEVQVARDILAALQLRRVPLVIACPTCSRTSIDVAALAQQVEELVAPVRTPLTIAVMGCIVNGPGEAREADIGVAGGQGEGRIFIRGVEVERVREEELLDRLMERIRALDAASTDPQCCPTDVHRASARPEHQSTP